MPHSRVAVVLSIVAFAGGALLAAGGFAQAPAAGQVAPNAEALARSLQQNYDKVLDFRASFEQTSSGGVLKLAASKSPKGEGTVAIKKPGRMRWEYTKPDKQTIVSDGTMIYSCYLDTKECDDPQPVPRGDAAPSATLFLAGKADILRDFKVARVNSPVRDTIALRLDPRKPDPDYEYLVVAFDPKTYEIRGLMTRDRGAGESTIVFSNIKVNKGIPDSTFAPPRSATTPKKPH
jgi:outer membrane lipoprotein carrier protein